jgi:hypothetical protein
MDFSENMVCLPVAIIGSGRCALAGDAKLPREREGARVPEPMMETLKQNFSQKASGKIKRAFSPL